MDERIPLKHGVIGQETQGPGGFFMALRSIARDAGRRRRHGGRSRRGAKVFNYTNPINIVSQAVTRPHRHPDRLALRGADHLPARARRGRGLDPDKVEARDGRPEPRLVERRATVRRRGHDAADRGAPGSGARTTRRSPAARRRAATRRDDGRDPGRLLPVLLLQGRGAGRAAGEADHPRRGHPVVGAGLLAALPEQAASRRPAARSRAARAAASTSWSSRST